MGDHVFMLDIDGHKPFRLDLPTSATNSDLSDLKQQLDEYASKVSAQFAAYRKEIFKLKQSLQMSQERSEKNTLLNTSTMKTSVEADELREEIKAKNREIENLNDELLSMYLKAGPEKQSSPTHATHPHPHPHPHSHPSTPLNSSLNEPRSKSRPSSLTGSLRKLLKIGGSNAPPSPNQNNPTTSSSTLSTTISSNPQSPIVTPTQSSANSAASSLEPSPVKESVPDKAAKAEQDLDNLSATPSLDDSKILDNSGSLQKSNPSNEEWDDDEEEEDIVFTKSIDGKSEVRGGTLQKLVERLAYHKTVDTDYVRAFLLTYRSFTTPDELTSLLIQRYLDPTNSEGLDRAELENRTKIIKIRVGNVFKTWLESQYSDFEGNKALSDKLAQFITQHLQPDMAGLAKNLLQLLEPEQRMLLTKRQRASSIGAPVIVVPVSNKFEDFDPLEVARQLTLIEYDLFKSITSQECLGQAWNKADHETLAPNLTAITKHFNTFTLWVCTEVVREEKVASRAKSIAKFIVITKHCLQMGNFMAVMEIMAGLHNASVFRLKKTWKKVQEMSKIWQTWQDLLPLVSADENHRIYREKLKAHPLPAIPYVGLYLKHLTFIEDGNENKMLERPDLLNFEKRRMLGQVIGEIQHYQQKPYAFQEEQTIRTYIQTLQVLTNTALYKYSLICEPRRQKT